jgi:hypothetical protein
MQSNLRPHRGILLAAAIAAAALLLAPLGANGKPGPGCGSYKSQAAAQDDFIAAGGSPKQTVGRLDPDHDGIACEGLRAPYAGYATLGYNKRKNFFYGTASLPPGSSGEGFPCMVGNTHFPDAPRRLNVYKVESGGQGKPIFSPLGLGVEGKPASGRLIWRADRKVVVPGRYYAEFEARVRTSPRGGTECPSFRSGIVHLP